MWTYLFEVSIVLSFVAAKILNQSKDGREVYYINGDLVRILEG